MAPTCLAVHVGDQAFSTGTDQEVTGIVLEAVSKKELMTFIFSLYHKGGRILSFLLKT